MRRGVGITTNIEQRERELKHRIPYLKNWTVVYKNINKDQAESLKDEYLTKGYEIHSKKNNDTSGHWHVYTFEY